MSDTQPPLEYLVECSKASLESFQLSRLNRASNLQKEFSQVAEEWVQAEVSLRVAGWILERRSIGVSPPDLSRPETPIYEPCARLNLEIAPKLESACDQKQIERTLSRMSREGNRHQRQLDDRCKLAEDKMPAMHEWSEQQIEAHLEKLADQLSLREKSETALRTRSQISYRASTELCALEIYALGPPEPHSLGVSRIAESHSPCRKIEYHLHLKILAPPTAHESPNAVSLKSHRLLQATSRRAEPSDTRRCDPLLASAS